VPSGTLGPVETPRRRLELGRIGEEAALARYLRAGYRELARNWRCPLGEIDLVLARGGTVVFCEVKARRGAGFGGPHDAVTWRKRRRLELLAQAYLAWAGIEPGEVRFDVASVTVDRAGRASLFVFEGAF
jgi:putative endonuclease